MAALRNSHGKKATTPQCHWGPAPERDLSQPLSTPPPIFSIPSLMTYTAISTSMASSIRSWDHRAELGSTSSDSSPSLQTGLYQPDGPWTSHWTQGAWPWTRLTPVLQQHHPMGIRQTNFKDENPVCLHLPFRNTKEATSTSVEPYLKGTAKAAIGHAIKKVPTRFCSFLLLSR